MSEVLRRLGDSTGLTEDLDALGGEDLILQERRELVADPRNVTIVAAMCSRWAALGRHDEAVGYIINSVRASGPITLVDILDVVLDRPSALGDVAEPLATALSELSQAPGILGAVAWRDGRAWRWAIGARVCRLCRSRVAGLGYQDWGWRRFLVRAIGAALERWADQDVLEALTKLTSQEPVDDDAAYELGMHHLNVALVSTDRTTAVNELHEALRWLRTSAATDERPDAATFSIAVEQVVRFAAGETVTAESANAVRDSVLSYLRGYNNEVRHWRQPRGDVAACWADLVHALHDVADLREPAWWEPGRVLSATARVLDAHRSFILCSAPNINRKAGSAILDPRSGLEQPGLELLLRPPVQAALRSREENIFLIDRWLEEAGVRDSVDNSAATALREVREALRAEVTPNPKVRMPPVPALTRMLGLDNDTLIKLSPLKDHPDILEVLEARAVLAESQPGPTVAETVTLDRLLSELRQVAGYGDASLWIDWMVRQLLRFVMRYIDKQSGGQRAEPWQKSFARRSDAPKEDTLADSLARWLMATEGVRALVEVQDIGGGRVDVIVFFDKLRLVIEIKREFDDRDQDDLVAAYGNQAVQYASADIPFAFLAVLDLFRRAVRADLQSCAWVRRVELPEGSRTYGLTTIRVQASPEPPSSSSWKQAKKALQSE